MYIHGGTYQAGPLVIWDAVVFKISPSTSLQFIDIVFGPGASTTIYITDAIMNETSPLPAQKHSI